MRAAQLRSRRGQTRDQSPFIPSEVEGPSDRFGPHSRRSYWGVIAALSLSACLDFQGLITQCDAGQGPCAPSAGGGGGGGDDSGVGGGSAGGGGGTGGGGGGGGSTGDAGPECADGTGATLQAPDGSVAFCFNGFTWDNPLPHGADLLAVWGPAPDDVWAAGAAGMLMHWDGARWTSHQGELAPQSPGDRQGIITSISSSDGGFWLAGHDLKPHRREGALWTPTGANPVGGPPWRIAAMAVSPDGTGGPFAVTTSGEVYAVPAWTRVAAGPVAPGRPDFVQSLVVGDDGLVAFSGSFISVQTSVHRVWRLDAGSWTFDAGEAGALWFEHGQLVVASTSRRVPSRFSVWELQLDGGATERVSDVSDFVGHAAAFLPAIDAGYLVGTGGLVTDTWGNPPPMPTELPPLRAVLAFADGGSWAVGGGGLMLREQSGAWVPRQRGSGDDLYGIWISEDGGVTFCGRNAQLTERATMQSRTLGSGTLRDLHRFGDGGWVVASEDGNLWRTGTGTGVKLYQGNQNQELWSVLIDADEGWATGRNTIVQRQADGGWEPITPPLAGQEWWKVARAGSSYLFTGSQGAVAVFTRDAGWTVHQELSQGNTNYGVWTIDAQAGTAWVVGGGPRVWHFDADAGLFEPATIPPNLYGALYDVSGSAPNDVWAVGDDGLLLHYDGNEWTLVDTGTRAKLERVRSKPHPGGGRELIIIGEKGNVLHKRY